MTPDELRRFENFIDKQEGDDGCWIWTGHRKKKDGTARFRVGSMKDGTRRVATAHRLYYEHFNGPAPKSLILLHECGNSGCVRPSHIIVGTRKDLSALKKMHGTDRTGRQRGGANGAAKIGDRDAIDILWLKRGLTNKQVAAEYGVHHSTISALRRGITFPHLKRPEHEKYGTIKQARTCDPKAIIALHDKGFSYSTIGFKLGVPKSTVAKQVRKSRLQSAKQLTISGS